MAVKVLKASDARSRESFLNEMSILKSLHHSNIVQFLGACVFQNNVALVTEFMLEGDLWHGLAVDTTKSLSFYNRLPFVELHKSLQRSTPAILESKMPAVCLSIVRLQRPFLPTFANHNQYPCNSAVNSHLGAEDFSVETVATSVHC